MARGWGPTAGRRGATEMAVALAAGLLVFLVVCLAAPLESQATAPTSQNGRIAFSRSENAQQDIWLMNPDGSGQVDLTNTAAPLSEATPRFSPDGRRITYARGEAGQVDVFVMKADGPGQTNLTNTPSPTNEEDPSFSPDGRLIAFRRYDGMGPAD